MKKNIQNLALRDQQWSRNDVTIYLPKKESIFFFLNGRLPNLKTKDNLELL